ncbi:MAG TPA: glycosyltransferase [Sporichthyaceae bacterium]|nr:glycosyltransferase [Sporichthyaceae bacterium]
MGAIAVAVLSGLERRPSVAILSTYPPTQCGLATFSAALRAHLGPRTDVVRVVDQPLDRPSLDVVAHLVNGSTSSATDAVHKLNDYDVVIVQHEYGIFGGPDGLEVVALVESIRVPTIVVFHTVLETPTARQREILHRLIDAADAVVTMTATARRRLIDLYGADPLTVRTIPHGAVDHRKRTGGRVTGARPLVLTWGLLGPGKGIEWAIEALPGLRDLNPRYLVLGATHPRVHEREGHAYRDGLSRRARELGVADMFELDGNYLPVPDLFDVVASADLVLLPYDSREQVTSGVLIEAVAAGRPVVSTAFPHAVELLAQGAGLLVRQRDPDALGAAIRRVLTEPGLAQKMAARAAAQAPGLFWDSVAARYRALAEDLHAAAFAATS